jgi:hypothetical protein
MYRAKYPPGMKKTRMNKVSIIDCQPRCRPVVSPISGIKTIRNEREPACSCNRQGCSNSKRSLLA